MKKFQWSEDDIQVVLKQMPLVHDRRSKEEIYNQMIKKKKIIRKNGRIVSALVSIAAVCFFMMIGASLNLSSSFKKDKAEEHENEMKVLMNAEESSPKQAVMMSTDSADKVASRVVKDRKVVVLALPDLNRKAVIPVSVSASPNEHSRERQLQFAKEQLPGQLGLDNHWFDRITFSNASDDQTEWAVHVAKKHPVFSNDPSVTTVFLSSIEETIRWLGGTNVQFFTEHKKGINLPSIGRLESLRVSHKKRAYYFYQSDPSHPLFLAPSTEPFSTIEDAFQSMQRMKSAIFRPSISQHVHIMDIQKQGRHLIVQFTPNSVLNESAASQWMLEAMLLTAREFGFHSVTFLGGNTEQVGPYRLGESIRVPIAPNPLSTR
ncbi:UDP-glucose 6-dehydrogenase [Anoxybacillus rupiensis]|jgi:hypothetical protein|uniref:UDP-glucose 6-dehydrogenase n=1 Tax=Anoxybacteroides rupiense TaxID=311460 RepID=UPI001BAAB4CC|nr:UDP-glucose 6-dehydrogenase [Anoxybacillus rupiensis]MBS2770210.1 UDP-glucose 6-dehydrogenase [Anoxybacillus rupiensis]